MPGNEHDTLKFQGKITASVTHDLQNVLAIISENSGLMEDLILISQESESGLGAKLLKRLIVIKNQINRGVELTSELNHFAHASDHLILEFNPVEMVNRLIVIANRLISAGNMDITVDHPTQSVSVYTNPVLFQKALFTCIGCFKDCTLEESTIRISFSEMEPSLAIQMSCISKSHSMDSVASRIRSSATWTELNRTCQKMEVKPELSENDSGVTITLPFRLSVHADTS